MRTEKKLKLKQLRHWRIRKRVSGTAERPRMSVCFTNENIHVQFIDDVAGKTLAAVSTVSKGEAKDFSANVNGAKNRRQARGGSSALPRASRRWCLTAAARGITVESKGKDGKPAKTLANWRRWPMPRAKPD